jgi:hypothetical protein
MAIPGGVQVVAWLLVAGGVGYVGVTQARISERLDRVEHAHDGATPPATPDVEAVAKRVAAIEDEVGKQADAIPRLEGQTKQIWGELTRAPVAAPAGKEAVATDVAALSADPKFDEAVRGVVDKYVLERKFREAIQKASGPLVPKKPVYAELAKALSLRQDQAERFGGEIQGIQKELFDLLSVPRPDGAVLIEEIQQAEQYPEGSPQKVAVFSKLFKLTIPDTQETYVERAIALVQRVKAGAKTYFDEGQYQTLDTIDLDYFGIRFQ